MTSSASSSLPGRARSTRLAAPTKQLQSRNLAIPVSFAGSAPPAPTQSLPSATDPSNLHLFLANLRLLDLDLSPDWPGISAKTFANVASTGQRKRVQCVEWSLYQLFVLWDPEEARTKLQSFFPPTDQVQSLNLRVALLRALEQAKKSGVLGRDTVIRKTMLDECKGDRLEEVLAAFSFAVLRRVTGDRSEASGRPPAIAETLALENKGYAGERTELAVLKLAHQASLGKTLRKKTATRALFGDFSDLLDVKERSLVRRREQIKSMDAMGAARVTDDEKLDVWRMVRNNWAGSERWMETLLYGDTNARRGGLLTTPFDKVWRRVNAGRLSELEDRGSGLLEQLDGRVRFQRERLQKWEEFRKRMSGDGVAKKKAQSHIPPGREGKGLGLRFDHHQGLHLGGTSPRKVRQMKAPPLSSEYADLVASFERDLQAAGNPTTKPITDLIPPRVVDKMRLSAEAPSEPGVISELSELEEEEDVPMEPPPPPPQPSRKVPQIKAKHRPVLDRKSLAGDMAPTQQSFLAQRTSEKPRQPVPGPAPSPAPLLSRSPTRELIVSRSVRDPVRDEEPPPCPAQAQAQADLILESVNNASPSPTKAPKPRHTLSLDERTRLSMARQSSRHLNLGNEEESLPTHASRAPAQPVIKEHEPKDADEAREPEDLLARTRKSMAGFEAARQRAQLERRRSQRKSRMLPRREGSHFPKVEEDAEDASVLPEELMAGKHNYEDVFMSRPKIKTSPASSPNRGDCVEELETDH